jgi:hypothetical protein
MRKSVAEVPPKRSHEPEALTVMDVLTKEVLEVTDKGRSNTEGMPARLAGRVQKDGAQKSRRISPIRTTIETKRSNSSGRSSNNSRRGQ